MSKDPTGNTDKENHQNLKFSLLENAVHSYNNGKKKLSAYARSLDQWELKEAILFIHNGMELFLKHILANEDKFLIFENVDEAVKAIRDAREQDVDVFSLNKSPNTVTFLSAISRVESIYEGPNTDLFKLLKTLNKIRNRLEHYGGEFNGTEVVNILDKINEQSYSFLTKYGVKEPTLDTAVKNIDSTSKSFLARENEAIQRVLKLMNLFNGQRINGALFGKPGIMVSLPKFKELSVDATSVSSYGHSVFDALGIDKKGKRWIVEIKTYSSPNTSSLDALRDKLSRYSQLGNVVWLILYSRISSFDLSRIFRILGDHPSIYTSTEENLTELENTLSKV